MASKPAEIVISTTTPAAARPAKCSACCAKPAPNRRIVEYLKTPPTRAELLDLLRRMDMKPRALLRRRGTPYDELGLADPAKTDDALIDAMLQHPILIERPIVRGPRGVRLCRPVERVYEVLPPS